MYYETKGEKEMEEEKKTLYANLFNIEFNRYDFRLSLGLKKDTGSETNLPDDYDLHIVATPLFIKELATKMLMAVSVYETNYMKIPYEEMQLEITEKINSNAEE